MIEAYIWHPHYVDALAARFWDSNADGDFADTDEVQYALHDANYNVTALVDTTGAVIERYEYTPYGEVTVLDADFSDDADGASDVENPYTYTGRRFDEETGLYYYRSRDYHAKLGRFVSRDPIGYLDGPSLYCAYFVPNKTDPSGLGCKVCYDCILEKEERFTIPVIGTVWKRRCHYRCSIDKDTPLELRGSNGCDCGGQNNHDKFPAGATGAPRLASPTSRAGTCTC